MKHILLRNPFLQGWEYGMLRALEKVIVQKTNATIIDIPGYGKEKLLEKTHHGMRLSRIRKLLPKKQLNIEGDVLWCILMGPENLMLDLFRGWQNIKTRVVYIFDTLPPQYDLIRSLSALNDFNVRITSFNDAREDLEKLTGRPWYAIEQAATTGLFKNVPFEEKLIHFSSYGRRWPALHKAVIEFCAGKGLYYDFTTHDGRHPTAEPELLYNQYAWHLNHSLFTFSWPVELTNPSRAGHLHPVTCRWFEAAASGTIIIGKKPGNENFDQYILPETVVELDPDSDYKTMRRRLEEIWEARYDLYEAAGKRQSKYYEKLFWENRVCRMLELANSHQESASVLTNDLR
jgi:hypothetical protein